MCVCVRVPVLLVCGLAVSAEEAVAVEELGQNVGRDGHVERRARLLPLKQVRVIAHLQKKRKKNRHYLYMDPGKTIQRYLD